MFCIPMCLKRVGVELALMEGTRPIEITAHVYTNYGLYCKLPLKPDYLPISRPLTAQEQFILDKDKRTRGERRPKRIHFGACHRAPYTFFSTALPGDGLPLTEGLRVEVWMHLYDPMWSCTPLFHFKCSHARTHPLTKRVHWIKDKLWTPAGSLGLVALQQDETPCGCGVRVRMMLLPIPHGVTNAEHRVPVACAYRLQEA